MATAKGHLDRAPSGQPHAASDAVSARRRNHDATARNIQLRLGQQIKMVPFSPTDGPRSSSIHLDYTGPFPEACSAGTRYLQISCFGGYINLQPLLSLRAEHTSKALKTAVEFFRNHGVTLDTVRMDSQQSPILMQMAKQLALNWSLVPPYVHNPNRAERAIRTAKNHIIATRAGFHPDCPAIFLDRCLFQIELTLNSIRPFDYDPTMSAYEGITGSSFNFLQHPIAPVGAKVLTWDSPDQRGTWADHGVPAVYLGPAPNHLRSFEVWVPSTSAARITNTVWWFLHDVSPDIPPH
jgi:hypothetical protein